MSTPSVSTTHLAILAILDRGPSFASKMIMEEPSLGAPREVNGMVIVDSAALYTKLKRMTKNGLIERAKNYRPPDARQLPHQTRSRAVWYRLTVQGRKVLQEHRALMK